MGKIQKERKWLPHKLSEKNKENHRMIFEILLENNPASKKSWVSPEPTTLTTKLNIHGKKVRKGLDALYRKVEKHLCEEENLLQVVWHSMQDEFIRQYNSIETLIHRCYPGSMIALEFSISDILSFFSDIAQQH
ncbi:EXOC1 [Cordylochernes scorpioides]|uniref:EXOC1 n=1 Tax=Cordylochernes scorpioides TaxID=51811 RepID=A0ABY6KPL9_9ARAC|nr:EXOC1 [Cordylochernes scorpioides]